MEFSYFHKKINLEKILSNDLIIKRKLKRNKKTNECKFFYEIIGKLEYTYDFSSLHDYVFIEKKDDEINFDIKSLKNHLINLDGYFYNNNNNDYDNDLIFYLNKNDSEKEKEKDIDNDKEKEKDKLCLMLDEHINGLNDK